MNRLAGVDSKAWAVGAVLREMSLTRRFEHSDCGDDSWIWELGSRTRKGTGRKLWGLGILGGGDCEAHSVDRSASSSTSRGSYRTVWFGRYKNDQGESEQHEKGGGRHEGRKEKVEIRSRAVTSRTWNRVTMASGLLTLPCPPTPVTGKVRLNVTSGFVSQPRAPGLLQLLPSMRLSPSSTTRPGGPWSCERGHSTPEVDLILPHSGLSLGRPRHLIDGPGGLEVERVNHAGLGLTPGQGQSPAYSSA